MFGNLGKIAGLMKQAKEIQKQMKEELPKMEFTASAGGDKVVAVVSGDFRVKKITINPAAGNDPAALAHLTTDAVNAAMDMAKNYTAGKMSELTGGVDIPGLF
ncbi:MAG: YbaB/EbfC family nucleoid-associated protein [Victivallaceae bacterium]